MAGIDEGQLNEFCEKLKSFRGGLEGPQQALFDSIIGIAWNATVKEEDLQMGFEGCFTADQAELILAYNPGGPVAASTADGWTTMLPRMITPGPGGIKGPHVIG
jgi:hypothetical protein